MLKGKISYAIRVWHYIGLILGVAALIGLAFLSELLKKESRGKPDGPYPPRSLSLKAISYYH